MMMKYSKRVAGIILCAAMAGNLLAGVICLDPGR